MHIVRAPHLRIHLLDGRVNFIVGGSLAASMNTNIRYVQFSLPTKDGRQRNTACLLTEILKGTTAAVQQWLWPPSICSKFNQIRYPHWLKKPYS